MNPTYSNFSTAFRNERTHAPAAKSAFRALALGILATACFLAVAPAPAQSKTTTFVLSSPSNNKTVKNKVKFSALLAKGLQKRTVGIEFWVDSEKVGTDKKAPYSINLDTRKFENGQHTLRVSLLVRPSKAKLSDPTVCEYLRAIYVNVKNKAGKKSAAKKIALPGPISTKAEKKKKWSLKFADEFYGAALDSNKWNTQRDDVIKGGSPYNNREGAWYGAGNNTVSGGSLVQTIKQEVAGDQIYQKDQFPYTTGMVNTHEHYSFQYGYIEARVKVPSCSGCWPVFWTLPNTNTWPPEIDFFEYIDTAAAERRPFVASHWQNSQGNQSELYYYTSPCGTARDYTNSWHTYGFMWNAGKIQPYLDGVPGPVMTGEAVPHVPMYLIMALSTVSGYAPAPGSQMLTDYVHVWQPKVG
jgi:beta-glucanase (GH16 family)